MHEEMGIPTVLLLGRGGAVLFCLPLRDSLYKARAGIAGLFFVPSQKKNQKAHRARPVATWDDNAQSRPTFCAAHPRQFVALVLGRRSLFDDGQWRPRVGCAVAVDFATRKHSANATVFRPGTAPKNH
ncbi:hypothetical protein psal_cds_315 [Pandoravirus salinus]|uniref:Uncharacterized protein n=1 Tax=Pandoravirus salinus TaxID=1349410 RepID=S4VWW3_9VIRU|nr:hypothetical protein psal_cds_315 [Pandoravirus salinus]AGO83931.2 hypothetical protein psal_cds_315 [Pandoravirus salinus]